MLKKDFSISWRIGSIVQERAAILSINFLERIDVDMNQLLRRRLITYILIHMRWNNTISGCKNIRMKEKNVKEGNRIAMA